MVEKRMLIVPAELAQKIDDNRGDMSRTDFIEFLINGQLREENKDNKPVPEYATKEEVLSLEQDIKRLLKTFLDFFVSYGLEIGKEPRENTFDEITEKVRGLEKETETDDKKGRATIKWK